LPNHTIDNEMMTVSVASTTRKRHRGVEFVVWKRGNAWFWFLTRRREKSGIIGATTNQDRAMRDARWSIEEILQSPEGDSSKETGFITEDDES
jgi:hypothetical protein